MRFVRILTVCSIVSLAALANPAGMAMGLKTTSCRLDPDSCREPASVPPPPPRTARRTHPADTNWLFLLFFFL